MSYIDPLLLEAMELKSQQKPMWKFNKKRLVKLRFKIRVWEKGNLIKKSNGKATTS